MTQQNFSIRTDCNLSLPAKIYYSQNKGTLGTLIYFHGGGLIFGEYDDLPKDYIDVLAEHFDILLVSYRLLPESNLKDIFIDIKNIYNYSKSLGKNIYVFGRSAGGYLSYLISKHFEVQGAIIFYGYYNFKHSAFKTLPKDQIQYSHLLFPSIEQFNVRDYKTVNEPPNPRFLLYLYYRHLNMWLDKLQVGLNDSKFYLTDEDLLRMPKTCLVHCKNDADVPFSYSESAAKLISNSKLIELNLNTHDFDRTVTHKNIRVYEEVVNFFKQKS